MNTLTAILYIISVRPFTYLLSKVRHFLHVNKNRILIACNITAAIAFLWGAGMIEQDKLFEGFCVCMASLIWGILFTKANEKYLSKSYMA